MTQRIDYAGPHELNIVMHDFQSTSMQRWRETSKVLPDLAGKSELRDAKYFFATQRVSIKFLTDVQATTCVSSPHRGATNTNRRPLMSESYTLPTEPEGIVATLLERFNSGKVSAMMGLYAPEAVFIAKDGRTITDHTEIAAELERDLKLGLPLEAKARHVFVAGDIAQIVLDWSIDGTGPDGKHVHLGGSASDILRCGADGLWRYIIDNNQGTAVRQPA
jgi:ketosteroid isomerase-like protein